VGWHRSRTVAQGLASFKDSGARAGIVQEQQRPGWHSFKDIGARDGII